MTILRSSDSGGTAMVLFNGLSATLFRYAHSMKMFPLVFLFLMGLGLKAHADLSGPAVIVDGDTLSISGNKVSLHGVDAPEKDQTCRINGVIWSCGYKVAEAIREWTYTKEVRCVGNQKDQYGNLIANCFVSGYNLNARIVFEGLGLADRKYSEQYIPEEAQAREAGRGLWAGEFVAPWDWRTGKRLN